MFTVTSANSILNALCGRAQYASLGSTAYIGLSTTEPTAAGGNITEPSGNGYSRVLLGDYSQSYSQKMSAASAGAIQNGAIIYFPEAVGPWGSCTHVCIFTAASGGTLLAYGTLTQPVSPAVNTIPIVRIGDLKLKLV